MSIPYRIALAGRDMHHRQLDSASIASCRSEARSGRGLDEMVPSPLAAGLSRQTSASNVMNVEIGGEVVCLWEIELLGEVQEEGGTGTTTYFYTSSFVFSLLPWIFFGLTRNMDSASRGKFSLNASDQPTHDSHPPPCIRRRTH